MAADPIVNASAPTHYFLLPHLPSGAWGSWVSLQNQVSRENVLLVLAAFAAAGVRYAYEARWSPYDAQTPPSGQMLTL